MMRQMAQENIGFEALEMKPIAKAISWAKNAYNACRLVPHQDDLDSNIIYVKHVSEDDLNIAAMAHNEQQAAYAAVGDQAFLEDYLNQVEAMDVLGAEIMEEGRLPADVEEIADLPRDLLTDDLFHLLNSPQGHFSWPTRFNGSLLQNSHFVQATTRFKNTTCRTIEHA